MYVSTSTIFNNQIHAIMSLAASLNKAKADIADAASRNLAHARPSSSTPARTSTPKPTNNDTKRSHETAFSSNNATVAPLSAGQAGGELLTNVVTAVKYLKDKDSRPVPFDDIIGYLSLPIDLQKNIPRIKIALRGHERVDYISKADSPNGKESFKYRPKHPVSNGDELREYLARQPTAQGVPVRELKDGWPDCVSTIDKLERECGLLATRAKDGTARLVWADSPTYHLLNPATQLPQRADQDFCDFWAKTKLPASEMDVRSELEKAGLTPTSQVKEVRKMDNKKKERKRVIRKNGKTTNSHMAGILKDYTRK